MSKGTVLVVEDEVLVGLEIREDLEAAGYSVSDVVASADAAMASVARQRPSLVVLDIRIEGEEDGVDIARKLREDFDLPALFLTAYSDPQTLERAATTLPSAYLLKPFDERELVANVEMILARSRAGGAGIKNALPLVEALSEPALIVSLGGSVLGANQAATRLLGAPGVAGLRGLPLSRFVMDEGDPGEVADGKPIQFLRDLGGSPLSAVTRIEPVFSEAGERMGSLVTFDSMSMDERLNLESSVAAINRTLEALVPTAESAGPGFVVSGFLLPCASGAGDLVDAFRLDSRVSAFCGLDVMGHGSLASLVAYSLHDLVRSLARERDPSGGFLSPASLIMRLNERYGENEGKPFFTITYGLIDGETGKFRLARAGHTPAIFLPAKGRAEILRTKGGAVGVVDELVVEEYSGSLGPGDRLFIASDGFIEAAFVSNSGEGLEAFAEAVVAGREAPLSSLVNSLHGLVVARYSRATLRDDASFLAIERRT
jgi:CheY-like chemotaxis protein